jgi:hypothetical protein
MIEMGTLLVTELANCALSTLCFRYFDILFYFVELPLVLSIGDMFVLALGPYSACGVIWTTDLRLPLTVLLVAFGFIELFRFRIVASWEFVILEGA